MWYYNNEDKISVAKYYPYTSPKVLRQVAGTDHTGMQTLKTKARLKKSFEYAKKRKEASKKKTKRMRKNKKWI